MSSARSLFLVLALLGIVHGSAQNKFRISGNRKLFQTSSRSKSQSNGLPTTNIPTGQLGQSGTWASADAIASFTGSAGSAGTRTETVVTSQGTSLTGLNGGSIVPKTGSLLDLQRPQSPSIVKPPADQGNNPITPPSGGSEPKKPPADQGSDPITPPVLDPIVKPPVDQGDNPITPPSGGSNPGQPSSGLDSWMQDVLDRHNSYRSQHSALPLTWSSQIAAGAQQWAEQDVFEHSSSGYGENLAYGYSPTGAVDAWYNEVSSYDFTNPGFSGETGHFTQVVWINSKQLGCGFQERGRYNNYLVCRYDPPGNVDGGFDANVKPRSS